LTGVAETRLLLPLEFPPHEDVRRRALAFAEREIAKRLFAPSIILTEFIKIAGARIGEEAAKTRIRLLKERGMRLLPLDEEQALAAGSLLLAHPNVPIPDALVASFVKTGPAEYVATDDPHYKTLGVRTRWF